MMDEFEELLYEFLNRWPIEIVENMTLQEYVGVGNQDTFCQWVETKTRMLGSIKGMTSIKFGIYERIKPDVKPQNYENGNKYSWLRRYGNSKTEAFENVKRDVLDIINFAEKGQFEKINEISLPDLFKWKVAFLYSNDRLIPIFSRAMLFEIAENLGLKTNRQTQISEIQEVMIANKPSHKNVYEYMIELDAQFGKGKDHAVETGEASKGKAGKRKGTTSRNTQSQIRTINRSYIVEQKHNKIQIALQKQLVEKYGKENVILEENNVDVKLIQPNYLGFYEVKSSSYASACIREALGQILLYSYRDEDEREKKIFVVGQYPPTVQEDAYIEYIKENLNLDFEYLNLDLSEIE